MKRILSLFLATILMLVLLSACSNTTTVSTGLGVTTSTKSSASSVDGKDGTAQVDSTVAAITLDENGVIVRLTIDAPQTRVVFTETGKITTGLSTAVQSKLEKGDNYGMRGTSGIGKEWYEQTAAFEAWAIGKTVDEVLGLQTKKLDDYHPQVPDDPELVSSVTITVGEYLEAIEKAAANAKTANTSENFKTGLGIITGIADSTDAASGTDGCAQVNSVIAAVTLNEKGKISACSIDAAQTGVTFDDAGAITADTSAEIKSAAESGGDYGTQTAAFAEWAVGKTAAELKGTKPSDVTLDVSDWVKAVEKAIANAK